MLNPVCLPVVNIHKVNQENHSADDQNLEIIKRERTYRLFSLNRIGEERENVNAGGYDA